MYTLNANTLSEDRLRKAVNPDTFLHGARLYENGHVTVQEAGETEAICVVTDRRPYRVEFMVAREHIYLKCTCGYAGRGLVCEHDVAAWLALHDHYVRRLPPSWQTQLEEMIGTAQYAPTRQKSSPYLLFFYLTASDQGYYDAGWKIIPMSLPLSALPAELRRLENLPDFDRLVDLIAHHHEIASRLKYLSASVDPFACLNLSSEIVILARVITLANNSLRYSMSQRVSIESFLVALRSKGIPLIMQTGNGKDEIVAVKILPHLVSLGIIIERNEQGLSLRPHIVMDNQSLEISLDHIDIISNAPDWLLADGYLFQIEPAGVSLLSQVSSTDNLLIPAEQESDFIDKYLLPLARQIPVIGPAVHWLDVRIDPVRRLYLSDVNGELQAILRFGYGEQEVRYDPQLPESTVLRVPDELTLVRVFRDSLVEKEAHDSLGVALFGLKKAALPNQPGLFKLRARTHPVDFLLNMVPRLAAAGYEVYGEEQLKTSRVNRNTPSISFKVSSGIDWFDIQAQVNFGELEVSFAEIRRALRKRERYIKLTDGSIGELPEEWLERYRHLFNLGEATDDGLRLSQHHIAIIEDALAEGGQVSLDKEYKRRRERLKALVSQDFQGVNPHPLPAGFVGDLRPYQIAGFEWLHFLKDYEFGGCLADDMGLGKTVQALVFLLSLYGDPATRPAHASLLVVPRSLLVNWQREAARFTPGLRILEFFDSARDKDNSVFDAVDLVITTYGVMLRDIQLLHGYTFDYAILDESQSIKNPLSQTARAAHLLRANHRLVLTGTPIENSTAELWSQFHFLNPGLLGSLQYFRNEFGLPIEKHGNLDAADLLRKMVYPFILRRTKDQVAPELPPRTERTLFCDMSPSQRKLYVRLRDHYRGVLLGMVETEGLNNSRMKILEGLLRLRQVSNHPLLVDEKFHGESGKFELLIETLETLRAEGHKALVFSQFVQMLSIVRQELDAHHVPYEYLDGQTQDRQSHVDAFQNNPEIPFFLISLKAGGLGLNLTAADYVIHIDPWWNPAVEMQASDRTHRIGQDKPVFIFKLIARDSVEEKIVMLQERKRQLVDQIITTDSSFIKNLTVDDIQVLFS